MRIRSMKRIGGALVAALAALALAVPASADSPSEIAGALPAALSAGLNDEVRYQSAAAGQVGNVTCRVELLANQGVAQTDPGPAVVKAHDVGSADIACASLDEGQNYTIFTKAYFQFFDHWTRTWTTIDETIRNCSQPSLFGQGDSLCAIQYTYPVGHHSVNKLHRACFDLATPVDLPERCSAPFLSAEKSFVASGISTN